MRRTASPTIHCPAMHLLYALSLLIVCAFTQSAGAQEPREAIIANFQTPPQDCQPRTRWWWMGNAIGKEDITWQLQQMHEKGIGGVEQITMGNTYTKGNVPYLSDEYFDLVVHAIKEAKKRGMSFSTNFGGPGWVYGGDWLPQEERSQNMIPSSMILEGPQSYSGSLPLQVFKEAGFHEMPIGDIGEDDRLVAVVAARFDHGRLDQNTLTILTSNVKDRQITWEVPEGSWRLMAFWLKYTGQGNALDHFNKEAVEKYFEYVGSKFEAAFGDEFGKTVESLFCDSLEVALIPDGIYWSAGLMEAFEDYHGYDLTPYLPAIWWEVGEIHPKIRYDVNAFLQHVGFEAFFKPMLSWCEQHNLKARIQPYGFPTDVIQSAGMTHLPEMEITAGEKDAVPWFDTRIGPKKYVSSGAHLYGRNIVTVEAYTYLHWDPYRATLQELKAASDVFLRSGANLFYNHGFQCSPERDIAPSRGFYAAIHVDNTNVWWDYYPLLSSYIARCCYMLRQGHFEPDIAIYSPLASRWAIEAMLARRWTRNFDWGGLGKLLLANGYDFDLINDDILQNTVRFEDGKIRVREMQYKVLLLPNIESLPLESLQRIEEYVKGGGVVVALDRVPAFSTGFVDHEAKDRQAKEIIDRLFKVQPGRDSTSPHQYGKGHTYFIEYVIDRSDVLEWKSSALDPFLNTLRSHITPDMGIDFVREDIRENNGLTFMHRREGERDIYFVTNLQDAPSERRIAFRCTGKRPWKWNPFTGEVTEICEYEEDGEVTKIPLNLGSYDSTFIVFEPGQNGGHIVQSPFREIMKSENGATIGLARDNGVYNVFRTQNGSPAQDRIEVHGIPAPFAIEGEWQLTLEGKDFPHYETILNRLESWTQNPETKHFSGTGAYAISFALPAEYISKDLRLLLSPGDVGNVAEIILNGKNAGVLWTHGKMVDITNAAQSGENSLTIKVTNTLINRVAGMKDFPPVPEHLRGKYGKGVNDQNPIFRQRLLGYEPLPRSGLLGPVKIIAEKKIPLGQ